MPKTTNREVIFITGNDDWNMKAIVCRDPQLRDVTGLGPYAVEVLPIRATPSFIERPPQRFKTEREALDHALTCVGK